MTFTIDKDSLEGVTIGIAGGRLTLDQIKQAASSMWTRVEDQRVCLLWDLREARFDLTTAEIRELADYVRGLRTGADLRSAFLTTRDLEFGLLRMFEAFRDEKGVQTSVFRDRDRALEWLRGDGDD